MKKGLVFALLMYLVCGSNLFAQEDKDRLFFTGTNVIKAGGTVNSGVIEKIDKLIDAELFASRMMPFVDNKTKNELKENVKGCNDEPCLIKKASLVNVKYIVVSNIDFIADSFRGILKLIDVNYGIEIAQVSKSGQINNIESVYTELIKDLVSKSSYFSLLKKMVKSSNGEYNPVLSMPGLDQIKQPEGSALPKIEKSEPPEQMSEFHDLSKETDKNLISLYDEALRAERLGDTDPGSAAKAWKKVYDLAREGSVIKKDSLRRSNLWAVYDKEIKEAKAFNTAVEFEKKMGLFPVNVVNVWNNFLKNNPREERKSYAQDRIKVYGNFSNVISEYLKNRNEFINESKEVALKNEKSMGLGLIKIDKKVELLIEYLFAYGSTQDGFDLLSLQIKKIPNQKDAEFASGSVFNKWNALFFETKCKNNDYKSCIISKNLFEYLNEKNKKEEIEKFGCDANVVDLCASFSESKGKSGAEYNEVNKIAEKSCFLGSGHGCFVLGALGLANNKNKEENGRILKVACERGYSLACNKSKSELFIISIKSRESKVVEDKKVMPEKTPTAVKGVPKEEPLKEEPAKKESMFLKTHPYFWYGFTSTIAGVALGIVSIYYGLEMDSKYSKYNENTNKLLNDLENFKSLPESEQITIINKIEKQLSDGDKYKKIAIGTGVAGGALFVTGIILMAVKKPAAESKTQVTFIPSKDGFMVGAAFNF
ncbi:MAG TPA: hypothetical protein PLW37_08960 [bacterium]|nr:hypothetical protein [bacterium]